MASRTIKVDGMSCDHCKNSIEGVLRAMAGVGSAAVDLNDKSVLVEFDESSADLGRIKEAIEGLGFQVV